MGLWSFETLVDTLAPAYETSIRGANDQGEHPGD